MNFSCGIAPHTDMQNTYDYSCDTYDEVVRHMHRDQERKREDRTVRNARRKARNNKRSDME